MKNKLSKKMSIEEFQTGYFYSTELKAFAREIGIEHVAQKRKDQIENEILHFLKTGKVATKASGSFRKKGPKDFEQGLNLNMKVRNFSLKWESRNWMIAEAKKKNPDFKLRSGVWYRIARWVEDNIEKNVSYRDLVKEFVRLCLPETTYERIPSTRYNNFVQDYLKFEKNVTRDQALSEWENLKKQNIPKDYRSWKKWKTQKI